MHVVLTQCGFHFLHKIQFEFKLFIPVVVRSLCKGANNWKNKKLKLLDSPPPEFLSLPLPDWQAEINKFMIQNFGQGEEANPVFLNL